MTLDQIVMKSEAHVDQGWAAARDYWLNMCSGISREQIVCMADLFFAAAQQDREHRQWAIERLDAAPESVRLFMFLIAGVGFAELQNRIVREIIETEDQP